MCKPRILFVDDDSNILSGIRRMLRRKKNEWEIHFAVSGAEALSLIKQSPFDIIVSDMRMPEMDGAEFLNLVAADCPDTIRMILSGHSEKEAIMRAIPVTHQYISKPCEANTLINQLNRSVILRKRVNCKQVRQAVSKINQLPSLPDLYQKICQVAQSDQAGTKEAVDIIVQDVAMSAKVLQLVNSSYFGIARELSSISQAISLLGMETLKSLVLSIGIFTDNPIVNINNFSISRLMHHSVACGALARKIILHELDDLELAEHAFIAGLLHDLGKILLASEIPELFDKNVQIANQEAVTIAKAEHDSEGYTHADVSGYLIGLWKLPMPVVEAVTFHHSPEMLTSNSIEPALAVYAANIIVQEQSPGESGNPSVPSFDRSLMKKMDLQNKIEQWRELLLEEVAVL